MSSKRMASNILVKSGMRGKNKGFLMKFMSMRLAIVQLEFFGEAMQQAEEILEIKIPQG